jgi:pyruvate formate lyase activating enzyme
VTLSGGEPTLYPEFAGRLAAALHAGGMHVLVETCGHFGWAAFARHVLPHVDAIYFDLKIADPAAHRAHTGRDNALILANLARLARTGLPVLARVPLVPGLTDGDDNLRALAAHVRAAGLERLALLPYNPLWVKKRRALGRPLPYGRTEWMPAAAVAHAREVVRAAGVEVVG